MSEAVVAREILRTDRLVLRELVPGDYAALCETLQDPVAMKAYEHAFADDEVRDWLDRQLDRYAADGFGLWAVVRRADGCFLGQCGITWQEIGAPKRVPEVGYLFARAHWHRGYATEAAIACRDYAFNVLDMPEVYSIIREGNTVSQKVALGNGMALRGTYLKHYFGVDMPHFIYSVRR